MAANDTLLGYLVPRYAKVTENAATDALAYIINRSAACMGTLNALVQTVAGSDMKLVTIVETQVSAPHDSIPDFVGFDDNGDKRVVGESKFWAGLGEGQAGVYLKLLPNTEPAVLLFVVPAVRIDRLWAAVTADAKKYGWEVADDGANGATRRSASVVGTEKWLMMVSWGDVLSMMRISAAREPGIVADIDQLLGLTRREDAEAFLPLSPEELGPAFPRRMQWLDPAVDDVIDARGDKRLAQQVKGLCSGGSNEHGHGRYFRYHRSLTATTNRECFFGVNFDLWVERGRHSPVAQVRPGAYRERDACPAEA